MIELVQVGKTFNAGKPNYYNALRAVDLSIDMEQITLFKGPSGAGKTTLLGIIGAMTRPTTGRVWISGREISHLPEHFVARFRRNVFGYVFQNFNLIDGISVLENVMLPAYPSASPLKKIRRRALEILDRLEIEAKAGEPVQHLSGGEQQRTAIARALINDPDIIIADEPTAHLDTQLGQEFLTIVAALKTDGKTVILASHDPILEAHGIVDRVIELRDGRVIVGRS